MDTQTKPLFKSTKSSKLFSFPDTEVYSFNLGANFLKNVNYKRNVTFKSCITGCFGGYESVYAAT